MAKKKASSSLPSGLSPSETLRQFVGVCTGKGWLNRSIRIRQKDRQYRVFCSKDTFLAYRINEHYGVSPGVPGWVVCLVNSDQMLDDSQINHPASGELSAAAWLQCLNNGDYEILQ
jgi:hypothetical protein